MLHYNDDPKGDSLKDELKKIEKQNIPSDEKGQDKFSPGEAEDYNPEDFATD